MTNACFGWPTRSLLLGIVGFALTSIGGTSSGAPPPCVALGAVPVELNQHWVMRIEEVTSSLKIVAPLGSGDFEIMPWTGNITGRCRDDVSGYSSWQFLYLKNGLRVNWDGREKISSVRSIGPQEDFISIKSTQPHPDWDGASFIMATRVSGPAALDNSFIGLWRKGQSWAIGAFSRNPDGIFTRPTVLLSSTLPIRSVTLGNTMHHDPGGTIGIIQVDREKLRLITVSWKRPALPLR